MDKKKIVIICLIITAIFLYLVASQFAEVIFDVLNIAVNRNLGLTVPELIGAAIAGIFFAIVLKNQLAMDFFADVVNEMAKVVYPTPKESGQSAVVVIIMVGIATILLAVFDTVWSFVTRFLLTAGGVN
jgi:preprotein translocase SecE subunit